MSEKFDLTVHKRNAKGTITNVNPYVLHIENGIQKFERPPGSGQFYYANGELIVDAKKAVKQMSVDEQIELKKEVAKLPEAQVKLDIKPEDALADVKGKQHVSKSA